MFFAGLIEFSFYLDERQENWYLPLPTAIEPAKINFIKKTVSLGLFYFENYFKRGLKTQK